jgi:hypothetical protein
MNKFKMLAIVPVAAAAIGFGGLVAPQSASAATIDGCITAYNLAFAYHVIGQMLNNGGNPVAAAHYFGMAEGIVKGGCGL